MNGKTGQVEDQLTDMELIKQFQEVEKLNSDEKIPCSIVIQI